MSKNPETLELRVLAGPQNGASLKVAQDASLHIGSPTASNCDVILRDELVREQRVRFKMTSKGPRVKVSAGTVDLDG